jgi:hypothetical protein
VDCTLRHEARRFAIGLTSNMYIIAGKRNPRVECSEIADLKRSRGLNSRTGIARLEYVGLPTSEKQAKSHVCRYLGAILHLVSISHVECCGAKAICLCDGAAHITIDCRMRSSLETVGSSSSDNVMGGGGMSVGSVKPQR